MIKQLIYMSEATHRFTESDFEELMTGARKRNLAHGVTGLLLYQGGTFLQVLEGQVPQVTRTMERISRDRRHKQIMVLHESQETERIFSGWDMGYLILEPVEHFEPIAFEEAMAQRFNIKVFREREDEVQRFIRMFVDNTSVKI